MCVCDFLEDENKCVLNLYVHDVCDTDPSNNHVVVVMVVRAPVIRRTHTT